MTKSRNWRSIAIALLATLLVVNEAPRAWGADSFFNTLLATQLGTGNYNATTTTPGTIAAVDRTLLNDVQFVVAAATTSALPAYTATLGAAGVGGTIQANANGALAPIDGVTLVANDPRFGTMLFQNGATAIDNGVYLLTNAGSGGTPWSFVRWTPLDTSAEMFGSRVRVRTGFRRAGAEYIYAQSTAPTVGTTRLWWIRTDRLPGATDQVLRGQEEFLNTGTVTGTGLAGFTTVGYAAEGMIDIRSFGTAATMGLNSTVGANNNQIIGELVAVTGTVANSAMLLESGSGTAGTGNSVLLSDDTGFDCEVVVTPSTLSNGTQGYSIVSGMTDAYPGLQTKILADGVSYIYDQTSAVSTTNWLYSIRLASAGTPTDTGVTAASNTYHKMRFVKEQGVALISSYFDDVLSSSTSSTPYNGKAMQCVSFVNKTLGTGSITAAKWDRIRDAQYFPSRN